MIHFGSILSLVVLIACHQMLIPKGQGGFFSPFNYNTWYLICEMFRNLEVSSAVSAWSLSGHETGGVHPTQLKQPTLLMAHSCLAHPSHWHPAPPEPPSAMSSTGNGWEHPESLSSPHPEPQPGWAAAHSTHRQGWWGRWRYTRRWGPGWPVLWTGTGDSKNQLPVGTLLSALLYAFLRQLSP